MIYKLLKQYLIYISISFVLNVFELGTYILILRTGKLAFTTIQACCSEDLADRQFWLYEPERWPQTNSSDWEKQSIDCQLYSLGRSAEYSNMAYKFICYHPGSHCFSCMYKFYYATFATFYFSD